MNKSKYLKILEKAVGEKLSMNHTDKQLFAFIKKCQALDYDPIPKKMRIADIKKLPLSEQVSIVLDDEYELFVKKIQRKFKLTMAKAGKLTHKAFFDMMNCTGTIKECESCLRMVDVGKKMTFKQMIALKVKEAEKEIRLEEQFEEKAQTKPVKERLNHARKLFRKHVK